VLIGGALTLAWQLFMGLYATSVRGLILLELAAVLIAAVVAGVLLRFGDRGVAVGVGIAATAGGCLATAVAIARWVTVGWPL
jgi:hypothetical protein